MEGVVNMRPFKDDILGVIIISVCMCVCVLLYATISLPIIHGVIIFYMMLLFM